MGIPAGDPGQWCCEREKPRDLAGWPVRMGCYLPISPLIGCDKAVVNSISARPGLSPLACTVLCQVSLTGQANAGDVEDAQGSLPQMPAPTPDSHLRQGEEGPLSGLQAHLFQAYRSRVGRSSELAQPNPFEASPRCCVGSGGAGPRVLDSLPRDPGFRRQRSSSSARLRRNGR